MSAMSTLDGRWANLVATISRRRADAMDRCDEIVMSILAGETVTIFGKPVEFTLSWPDGMPLQFTDEAELREWSAEWLAQIRERRRMNQEAT